MRARKPDPRSGAVWISNWSPKKRIVEFVQRAVTVHLLQSYSMMQEDLKDLDEFVLYRGVDEETARRIMKAKRDGTAFRGKPFESWTPDVRVACWFAEWSEYGVILEGRFRPDQILLDYDMSICMTARRKPSFSPATIRLSRSEFGSPRLRQKTSIRRMSIISWQITTASKSSSSSKRSGTTMTLRIPCQ